MYSYVTLAKENNKTLIICVAMLDLADDSGLPPKLAFEMISREPGGRESLGFTSSD
ncbi:protein FAR1-RELATED SEQUENCE 5-like protein [Corchorus olitorius]|uniref:Protein FAR1-RELATED SEQUENCE 5-like protein n=1 Tax=Corchorus olitorius TaxID=93759 RepID=A0A1R3I6B5_9ROSI|nr:protein FAR1-RELATED SEQUENCE 5-like protein [Corchorus olitorius]